MKRIAWMLALILVVLLAACGTVEGDAQPAGDTAPPAGDAEPAPVGNGSGGDQVFTIALSTKTITNNEFQRAVVEAAQRTVEASGYKFELTLAGDELAIATQVNNIEDLINKEVDALIVMPMDGQAVLPALKKAQDAGIPVIIADAAVNEGNEELYVTYIGTDNYAVGQRGAQEMMDIIGEGEVVIVRGAAGAMGGELRASGFIDGIEGSGLTLVSEQNGDWQSEVAMRVTENMIQGNPDIKGIFVCSDGMLPGVISAVDNAGKADQITIISVDGDRAALEQIEAGNCYGTVGQYPERIGELSAQVLIDILEGNASADSFEKFTNSGFEFWHAGNLEQAYQNTF